MRKLLEVIEFFESVEQANPLGGPNTCWHQAADSVNNFLVAVGGRDLVVRSTFCTDTDDRVRESTFNGLIKFTRLARDGNRPGQTELNAKRHRCWSFDLFQERNTQPLSFRV